MSTTSPILGLPIPDDDSPNDPPIHFQAFSDVIDDQGNPRFTSVADRDTAITAPVNGMECWTDDAGKWLRRAGAWVLVLADTLWQNLTTVNAPFVVGSNGAKYRVINGECFLSVHVHRNTSNWTGPVIVFTLAAGIRPVGMPAYCHTVKSSGGGDTMGNTTITTNGNATYGFNGSTGDDLFLSAKYPVV